MESDEEGAREEEKAGPEGAKVARRFIRERRRSIAIVEIRRLKAYQRDWLPGYQWEKLERYNEKMFPTVGAYRGQIDPNRGLHGKGSFVYTNNDVYEGDWDCGMRHGTGMCVYANGLVYEGGWVKGVMQGEGVLKDALDKCRYTGSFREGLRDGFGREVTDNGHEYEGEWIGGRKCGQGKMTDPNGDVYEGNWDNNHPNGLGVKRSEKEGWVYSGMWKKGRREGKGVLTFKNGDRYEGEMKADKMEGKGNMRFAAGGFYDGEWANNKRHGEGNLWSADNQLYSGFWDKGYRCGLGSQGYKNSDRYEGRWELDRHHGFGTYIHFHEKKTYSGHWHEGHKHGKGKLVDEEGTYDGEWVNDVRCGSATMKWKDGASYVGTYVDDRTEGRGVLRTPLERFANMRRGTYDFSTLVYTGSFLQGRKHGEGLEEWGIYSVWVTYEMGTLTTASLHQQHAKDPVEMKWAYTGKHHRGRVTIDAGQWSQLNVKFPVRHKHRSVSSTDGRDAGTPRAVVKQLEEDDDDDYAGGLPGERTPGSPPRSPMAKGSESPGRKRADVSPGAKRLESPMGKRPEGGGNMDTLLSISQKRLSEVGPSQ